MRRTAGRPAALDQERRSPGGNLVLISGTAFLALSGPQRVLLATVRLPAVFLAHPSTSRPRRQFHPSHSPCAGLHDLASVSMSVRPFSNNPRRAPAPVSTNVRRKPPLIARRGVHHCAPLHLSGSRCAGRIHSVPDHPSFLRVTGADVFTIAIDLHTGRYTYVSHLRGVRAHGTCQPRETST